MLERLKHTIRLQTAELLFKFGFLDIIGRRRLKGTAVVLMYHRILDPQQYSHHNSHPGICIKVATFEKQIRFLKKQFRILSLEEFTEHLDRQSPFPDRSCLITFDDGWRDNYQNAIPVLAQYQVPAVIFLSTAFVGSHYWFWQEKLNAILNRLNGNRPGAREIIKKALDRCGLDSNDFISHNKKYRLNIEYLFLKLKNVPQKTILRFISILENSSPSQDNNIFRGRDFMNWDEIRKSPSQLISFGSHGVNHSILTVETDSALEELAVSKSTIESEIGQKVIAFSYPNGNFSDDTIQKVKSCHYQLAFCTKPGYVKAEDDRFSLSRINIHESISKTPGLLYFRILFNK
jgi:peptidoglycan/xylan/chitin deacetylase (PgdA/CDA1 family)